MTYSWNNLKIRYKIIILAMIIIVCFALTVFAYLVPLMEQTSLNIKREKIKDIVNSSISLLGTIEEQYRTAGLPAEEAQKKAAEYIRHLRYGDEGKDYLWINDFHPRMIMHPFVESLNGKDISDNKDPNGKKLFVEMAETCKRDGEGFVEYMWQYKDNKDKIVPKISYVKSFKPWGWIVGTGIYVEDVRESIESVTRKVMAIFGMIILAGLTVAYFISRKISKPINTVIHRLEELANAEGDLTMRMEVEGNDEMGDISRVLNKFLDQFEHLIAQIVNTSRVLNLSVQEIARGNENLSQRTSEQASALQEIVSTLEEAATAIEQNAENTQLATSLVNDTSQKGSSGSQIVGQTVDSMAIMNDYSKRITEIVEIINNIAFQTNLLSLNAAIEAARVGDQGRGFAVVAGEVRNLAKMSADAARQIAGLIDESSSRVSDSVTLANKSGEALQGIVDAITDVTGIITEIAVASEQQRQGMNQVNIAISEIDQMSQQNMSLVEETAATSEEISNMVRELMSMVERFKIHEDMTSEMISFSSEEKTGGTPSDDRPVLS